MAYNSFSNKLRDIGDDIKYSLNFLKSCGQALITGNKKTLVLLLSFWVAGVAGCNKSNRFDLNCRYGKGTIQASQPTKTIQVGNQNNADIPLVVKVEDRSECTEQWDVKIEWYCVDNATGSIIANSHFVEDRTGVSEWYTRAITQSVHVPYTCWWVTVKYKVSSNTNQTTIWEKYTPSWEKCDEGAFSYNLVH